MWISIKTALQIELCNSFDTIIGLILYKSIITLVLIEICKNCVNLEINDELICDLCLSYATTYM